jgi:hypothetical protein
VARSSGPALFVRLSTEAPTPVDLAWAGWCVIPVVPRTKKLGLEPGDPLVIGLSGDCLVLRKVTMADLLEESARNRADGKVLSHEETFRDLV